MEARLDDARPGMVLSRDLVQSNRVLLSEGAILTQAMIDTIRRRGIRKVDVVSEGSVAPGSNIFHVKSADLHNDSDYRRERDEIHALFANVREDDAQMTILKYCILRQLEERYHDRQSGH